MIEISQLAKKFTVENPKKLSEQEKKDPRLKGRFFHSVENVSFHCSSGEVLGLLGPNGAGKTTTLRMLSTALTPDAGDITIDGTNVVKTPVIARKMIGFLSGSTGLYGRLTGRENIAYFGQLHGMSAAQIDTKIAELADVLDLHSFLDRKCENFSTGMKQKTAIARAVVHDPKVVILDEPTTGLDIMAAQTVLDFIQRLKEKGVPVIFSTHHLDEVSELCDRVTVIHHGKTHFSDTFDAFKAKSDGSLHQAFMRIIEQGGE
ncbi:sodium transport system ATP-binding protein [Marisediminitalea aggregata]|jgi:sodium transport system ATP-binding protein|uniref:Sodium transport system ATP-binding protein n=1 Tax=Marisediminitalea aggregata TaxID=634436 RepID=A0A1M5RE37_9ALTE|nr:ATP-binding cassette domain-containing protein [Marisediminitalea aggregata]MCP3865108.1 ATP-binding cassette domain-containing protein [Aestuariibacter sp.]MCP4232231.1 ATP-binding cassette domain-containing protein [Aestuariibacter sp.]MCP4528163.1 ATP-binding cassette domain-containing protein [Aestuariibacter sp.]MCP4945958.1 ATP-binding cassette domain-containing protein [Aestuariibacter sp.]MCP5011424.1 ATP-binding cassette domain-containing protein [Aestuariibacter sp.]|tara:strand:+ start:2331 stop:3113 length:783 start_codon:yes stop_codon:yes gene_type:complete